MPRATVYSLAWNPAGTLLACASASGAVRVYAVDQHEMILQAIYPADDIASRDVAWTRDGEQIIVVGERPQIALWSPFRGMLGSLWDSDFPGVFSVHLHPTEPLISTAGSDRYVRVYKLSGERINEAFHGQTNANVCQWKPDGSALAIANWEGAVQLWYRETNQFQPLLQYEGHVTTLDWHPEADLIALGGEKNVATFWSLSQGKIAEFTFEYPHVDKVAWHPAGRHVAVVAGDVHIYRFEQGQIITPPVRIETEEPALT